MLPLLCAIDGPGLAPPPPHKSATSSAQENIKGSLTALHVTSSIWVSATETLFETHREVDPGPCRTAGTLRRCLPQTRHTVFAELENRLKGSLQATRLDHCCRILAGAGLTGASGLGF